MAGQATPDGTGEVLLFLGTAGIAVPLFHRLRVSPVLGFLIAGVALGPYGLGWPAPCRRCPCRPSATRPGSTTSPNSASCSCCSWWGWNSPSSACPA